MSWAGVLGLIDRTYPPQVRWRSKTLPSEDRVAHSPAGQLVSPGDLGMEEAHYEITPMRQLARLTLSAPIPEDTMVMSFHHLQEKHQCCLQSSRSPTVTCRKKFCRCAGAPSSTQPLFIPHTRPRTKTASAIPRGIGQER